MSRLEIGRINRAHYWMLLVVLLAGKFLLSALGGSLATLPTLIFMYFILVARFHDFGAPTWLAATLMALVYGTAFAAGIYLAAAMPAGVTVRNAQDVLQHLPPVVVLLLVVPEPILALLAGTVAGHTGHNPYGPPNQAFSGILPRRSDRLEHGEPNPISDRIGTVLANRSVPVAEPSEGPRSPPQAQRRTGAPAFGRR